MAGQARATEMAGARLTEPVRATAEAGVTAIHTTMAAMHPCVRAHRVDTHPLATAQALMVMVHRRLIPHLKLNLHLRLMAHRMATTLNPARIHHLPAITDRKIRGRLVC